LPVSTWQDSLVTRKWIHLHTTAYGTGALAMIGGSASGATTAWRSDKEKHDMTSRERVLRAIAFEHVDRVPMDLGGMRSTGISCFAYPKLVAALNVHQHRPRVHDTGQMLALPEIPVLDALGCDVVTIEMGRCTNAFDEPARWHAYDFNGRLQSRVMEPGAFEALPDGTLRKGNALMVPDSYVFDSPHGGQEINLSGDIPLEDLDALLENLAAKRFSQEDVDSIAEYCRRVREATERAIMFCGFGAGLGYRGGMANFSILCMTEPEYVTRLHTILTDHYVAQAERLLPAIAPHVDILMACADDQGTQNSTILPPAVFRDLFVPYYRRGNDAIHALAPEMKTFLHCCGAVYDILDDIIDAGFDILNPVQWCAGGHSFREWKATCRRRIALWGGGVNTQSTLPLGTIDDVRQECTEVVACLAEDSGYVFCAIHNLLAEIPPEKIIALYETARAR
jgi:uroporphyrinogen decarboxylase